VSVICRFLAIYFTVLIYEISEVADQRYSSKVPEGPTSVSLISMTDIRRCIQKFPD
jgi:hypothetical protein